MRVGSTYWGGTHPHVRGCCTVVVLIQLIILEAVNN